MNEFWIFLEVEKYFINSFFKNIFLALAVSKVEALRISYNLGPYEYYFVILLTRYLESYVWNLYK